MDGDLEKVPYRATPYFNYFNILSCFIYSAQCIPTLIYICNYNVLIFF